MFGLKVKSIANIAAYEEALRIQGDMAPFIFRLKLAHWYNYEFGNVLDRINCAHGHSNRFGTAHFVILNLFAEVALPAIHRSSRPVWRFHHNYAMSITTVVQGCLRIMLQRVMVTVKAGQVLFLATGMFFEICEYPEISLTSLH